MNYEISRLKDCTVIEASGKIDRAAVISASSYLRGLDIDYPETVILDINGIEDEREMFYHVALINTVKKGVEQSGGTFILRASGASVRRYMRITGLDMLFCFDEPGTGVDIKEEAEAREFERC